MFGAADLDREAWFHERGVSGDVEGAQQLFDFAFVPCVNRQRWPSHRSHPPLTIGRIGLLSSPKERPRLRLRVSVSAFDRHRVGT